MRKTTADLYSFDRQRTTDHVQHAFAGRSAVAIDDCFGLTITYDCEAIADVQVTVCGCVIAGAREAQRDRSSIERSIKSNVVCSRCIVRRHHSFAQRDRAVRSPRREQVRNGTRVPVHYVLDCVDDEQWVVWIVLVRADVRAVGCIWIGTWIVEHARTAALINGQSVSGTCVDRRAAGQ